MRCGAGESVAQVIASRPIPATPTNQGRALRTGGCAVNARRRSSTLPPAALRKGSSSVVGRAAPPPTGAGTRSLIYSDPHPHDVLVRGQQLLPDVQRGLEGDAGFLPREHDLGDVGDFAALVAFAQRRSVLLRGVDTLKRALERVGEPAARLRRLLRGTCLL